MRSRSANSLSLALIILAIATTGCYPYFRSNAPANSTSALRNSVSSAVSSKSISKSTLTDNKYVTNFIVDGSDGYWYKYSSDAYEYSLTPENQPAAWDAADPKQRRDAQNLPENILQSISTYGLVETCFNNSCFIDFLVLGSNYFEGAVRTFENFNSGQELLRRPDASAALLDYYKSINVMQLYTSGTAGEFKLRYIEYVISDNRFVQNMTSRQRRELIIATMANVYARDMLTANEINFMSSALLIGRLLQEDAAQFGFINDDLKVDQYLSIGDIGSETMSYKYRELIYNYEKYISINQSIPCFCGN